MKLPVLIDWEEIGFVVKVDNRLDGTLKARELNAAAGVIALESCFRRYRPTGMPPQERLLRTLRAIGEALNEGKRDEYLEQDIMTMYTRMGGLRAVSQLLATEPARE